MLDLDAVIMRSQFTNICDGTPVCGEAVNRTSQKNIIISHLSKFPNEALSDSVRLNKLYN